MNATRRLASFARLTGLAALGLAGALVLSTAADAAGSKRIEFKNGHVLDVSDFRVEGETVYATLADGSEVGFPSLLIDRAVDSSKNLEYKSKRREGADGAWSNSYGRFGRWEDLPSVQRQRRTFGVPIEKRKERGSRNDEKPMVATGTLTGGGQTVGYDYRGKERADDPSAARKINAQTLAERKAQADQNAGQASKAVRGARVVRPAETKANRPFMVRPGQSLNKQVSIDKR